MVEQIGITKPRMASIAAMTAYITSVHKYNWHTSMAAAGSSPAKIAFITAMGTSVAKDVILEVQTAEVEQHRAPPSTKSTFGPQ